MKILGVIFGSLFLGLGIVGIFVPLLPPSPLFGGRTGAVEAGPTRLDRGELPEIYDPAHPMAGDDGYYRGSSVDLVVEIADAKEASRSYEANLRVFEQSRQMGSSLLDLIRR